MEDAYIAGLFDGEGSVGIYRVRLVGHKAYWAVQVSVSGTHRPMIEAVHAAIPGSRLQGDFRTADQRTPTKVYSVGHRRPIFRMQLCRQVEARMFLCRIRPYLIEKAEQVDIALAWLDGRLPGAVAERRCRKAKQFKFRNLKSAPSMTCGPKVGAKLTLTEAVDIRKRVTAGERQIDLAREYEVSSGIVHHIVVGNTYHETPRRKRRKSKQGQ